MIEHATLVPTRPTAGLRMNAGFGIVVEPISGGSITKRHVQQKIRFCLFNQPFLAFK